MTRLWTLFQILLLSSLSLLPLDLQAFDSVEVSKNIAESIHGIKDKRYSTIAFSRILGNIAPSKVNELIDYTNVALVRARRFRVVDRSKLQLILQEQQFTVSGMVSKDTYRELGKLLGVDLFIYGRYYGDSLVLKATDVESSAIIWADVFQLEEFGKQTRAINQLAEKLVPSIQNDIERFRKNKINQISFWNIQSAFNSAQVIDFFSVAMTRAGLFQVVDRDNLGQLLEEQKLNMEEFIDQNKAKKMGELYGIDAFFYGTITTRPSDYLASLKLLNIYNGVIEWADLLQFEATERGARSANSNHPSHPPRDRDPFAKVAYTSPGSQPAEGDGMVFIPGGKARIGSNSGERISRPEMSINVPSFFIDRYEVSNKDYQEFVKRFKHRTPPSWVNNDIPNGEENLPVVMVNWEDANRYCRSQNKRLPREVEWEKAFRGQEGNMYPWGNTRFLQDAARTVESGIIQPMAVNENSQDVSTYGVHNLAGNVREWVEDYLKIYPGNSYFSPKTGHERIIRGSSWAQTKRNATGWFRDSSNQTYAWKDVGFRCARSVK